MKFSLPHLKSVLGLAASCSLLSAGALEAKPGKDKDKGNGKDDSPGQSEEGKKGGKNKAYKHDEKAHERASKELRKDIDKDHKDFDKDFKDARKDAEKKDKEYAKWREKQFRDNDRDGVIRYFSEYRESEYGLPPGLAKNLRRGKPLPPGWRKKVNRGYVIEDNYRDDFYPLSYDLFPGLEVVPDTRLYRYGDRIVRVYEPRREVIDVIIVPTIRFD